MKNPPFKVNGIYIRKLDPKKDYENYKNTTKLKSILNAAVGKKENPDYEAIWFYKKRPLFERNYNTDNNGNPMFYFNSAIVSGELFEIADWLTHKMWEKTEYYVEEYNDEDFEFSDNEYLFSGTVEFDFLTLRIENKNTEQTVQNVFRFIPSENNRYMIKN